MLEDQVHYIYLSKDILKGATSCSEEDRLYDCCSLFNNNNKNKNKSHFKTLVSDELGITFIK